MTAVAKSMRCNIDHKYSSRRIMFAQAKQIWRISKLWVRSWWVKTVVVIHRFTYATENQRSSINLCRWGNRKRRTKSKLFLHTVWPIGMANRSQSIAAFVHGCQQLSVLVGQKPQEYLVFVKRFSGNTEKWKVMKIYILSLFKRKSSIWRSAKPISCSYLLCALYWASILLAEMIFNNTHAGRWSFHLRVFYFFSLSLH